MNTGKLTAILHYKKNTQNQASSTWKYIQRCSGHAFMQKE